MFSSHYAMTITPLVHGSRNLPLNKAEKVIQHKINMTLRVQ